MPPRANLSKIQDLVQGLRRARVRLVKASWILDASLDELDKSYQELGEGHPAFATEEDLDQIAKGNKKILSLSYVWQSQEHPDPAGKLAEALKKILLDERPQRSFRWKYKECLVFWDYKSVPQKARRWKVSERVAVGNQIVAGGLVTRGQLQRIATSRGLSLLQLCHQDNLRDFVRLENRSAADQSTFGLGLDTLPALYAHNDTWGVIVDDIPVEAPNPTPYDRRGWPLFESSCLSLSTSWTYDLKGNFQNHGSHPMRTKAGFDEELDRDNQTWRVFAGHADRPLVRGLYHTAFDHFVVNKTWVVISPRNQEESRHWLDALNSLPLIKKIEVFNSANVSTDLRRAIFQRKDTHSCELLWEGKRK